MTIDEVKEEKLKAEKIISEALRNFETLTKVNPIGIEIARQDVFDKMGNLVDVNYPVEIAVKL
jgi:hypothetical protein